MKHLSVRVAALFFALSASTPATANSLDMTRELTAPFAQATFSTTLEATVGEGVVAEFAQGSWTFQTYGSAGFGRYDGNVYRLHAGVGYYLCDSVSINLEGVGAYIDSNPRRGGSDFTSGGAGLSILLRWHFFRSDDDALSLYVEGGSGILYTANRFPRGSNTFNFASELGLGLTYRLCDHARLMTGVRYMHISNAGLSSNNPGYDAAVVYAGLMCRF